MITAKLPQDEDLRLLDFHSYHLMDSGLDLEFDELVELAANSCRCPVSVISLLDENKQWFRARWGTSITDTPREHAICGYTILQDNILEIEDARNDERFTDNPLVCGEMNIRFYAGVPIVSPAGYKLGSVCVIDHKPRKLTKTERKSLTLIASYITRLLELKTKNKSVQQRATKLLKLNNLAIKSAIDDNESLKETISVELHEHMAQVIAAVRLYLQMAIQGNANSGYYIQQSIDDLGVLLNRARKVSYNLFPGGVHTFSLEEMLNGIILSDEKNYPFKVGLACYEHTRNIHPDTNLACIRIIERWMNILEKAIDVQHVQIVVSITGNICIEIEDDGAGFNTINVEERLYAEGIYGRVQKLKGGLTYRVRNSKNILRIQIANPA